MKTVKARLSILEALAIGLSGYITGVRDVDGRNFTNDEVHRDYTRRGDGSLSEDVSLPVDVSIDAKIVGYVDTFTDSSNRDLFLNWCVKMEQIAWQKKQEIREYEAVKKAAADFMKYMDDSDLDYTVSYDRQFECIVFDDGKNITPIIELSAGYQSLIWMVLDIAYRMAVLNPFLLDDIAKTSGVVLIDELDMHLHPR